MDILHITSRKRDTYQVELTHSPLWECALGIAAITNKQLIDTLEKPNSYWPTLKENFSDELLRQLLYVEENNTWKALLQLLHYYKGTSLSDFCQYINELDAYELKFICFPYIGEPYQEVRKNAAEGDSAANLKLIKATEDNPFFPQYVDFLFKVETARLKQHLIYVMTSWFNTVIKPKLERIEQILEFDYKSKLNRKQKLNPEELVHWATGGVHYMPEPSVYKVLLIPQFIYRPWNIEADIEGTKVFYYPVANESLSPDDKYMPSNFLVQKYKALGDDVRLRIVKLLFEKDRSLQDITNMLDMGKSTVHHHLKILRASKIVGMKETKYALKENALNMLAEELSEYLNR